MSWTDKDDNEIQEYLDRLVSKQKKLESQLTPISVIINNIRQIQTRKIISYTEDREQKITTILPKDKWGEDMTNETRLQIKDECIDKTIELLGEIDE